MVSNRITDGVGKKIVDALKQQSDIEIQNVVENPVVEDVEYEEPALDKPQAFTSPSIMTFTQPGSDNFASELDDYDVPTNVAVLKQLINQLPAGVSRQTGALIIKQTMEALGISMKSVLQEAQMVQDNLNTSSQECQASIAEYRKQIGVLEKQSQKLQRQYSALNEIISLFVQTSL